MMPLALRLISPTVARCYWALDSLTVGQRKLAALSSIDERPVTSDLAILRALGCLEVKCQAG